MKVLFLKKNVFVVCFLLFLIINITVVITLSINKIDRNNTEEKNAEIDNIDIDFKDDGTCNESNEFKERNEFLKEQYKNKKLVAITFDDGPSQYTTTLIDELKKRDVPATFFVLGSEVERYPEVLKFVSDTGNEIGIHSYEHKLFTKLSEEEILEQISKTKNIIYDITGTNPTLIRVPYGSTNKQIKKILEEHELESVLWNVDSLDWKLKNTNKVYNYVIKKFKGNDIILMHDSFKTSVEAATLIIDKLQRECYTFVTVSEFLKIKSEVTK